MAYYADYINPLGGKVFWVAPSGFVAEGGIGGSDNNDGLSPQKPLSTIQAGLDKCTNGQGDTVMLLPGSWTITAVLTMTKSYVTLRAARMVGPKEYGTATIVCATDCNMLTIDADYCTVAGIVFDDNVDSSSTNSEDLQINSTNTTTDITGTVIRNCFFDCATADTDRDCIRVGLDSNDAAIETLIEGCVVYDCEQDAIVISDGSVRSQVRDCLIHDDGTRTTRNGVLVTAINCLVEGCTIAIANTTAANGCIKSNKAAGRGMYINNKLVANGSAGCCLYHINTATCFSAQNWLAANTANPEGELNDFATTATVPSCNIDWASPAQNTANPAAATLYTPTDAGA